MTPAAALPSIAQVGTTNPEPPHRTHRRLVNRSLWAGGLVLCVLFWVAVALYMLR